MLDFKVTKIDDKKWIQKCLSHADSMNCEYTFGNIFVWSTSYSGLIAHYKNFLICRWGRGQKISYSLPIGTGDFKEAVEEIIRDAAALGIVPEIYGVTKKYKQLLEELFQDQFVFQRDDGMNDYIYFVEKLAALSGKKYHSKRNHITNFKKNHPDWSFEVMDQSNISDCIEFHTQWIRDREAAADYSFEFEAALKAFEYYDQLDFVGGLIRTNGKVVAFTMGEPQNDSVFVTHFEKASHDMQGAYAIINQEFAKNCLGAYQYVNREEDLGLEGLRKAKMSYNPDIFLEKEIAVCKRIK